MHAAFKLQIARTRNARNARDAKLNISHTRCAARCAARKCGIVFNLNKFSYNALYGGMREISDNYALKITRICLCRADLIFSKRASPEKI